MAKLEGVIYKAFGNYVVLRGFAPIGEIAKISKKPESYQRDPDEQHKIDIIQYLTETKAYFPEVTLACRTSDYEGLIASIGSDKEVSDTAGQFVKGLRVLREYLPIGRDRARHAFLEMNNPSEEEKLIRVDGNHRLEPFSSEIEWWDKFVSIPEDIKNEPDQEKKEGWMRHQAMLYKNDIEDKIIPFTIVISEARDADNFEAKIFHDINFKQLPLRQEASLKIISELQVFEEEIKLGEEYPFAIKLINSAKQNHFIGIPLLIRQNDISKDTYRTACLRIVKLLKTRKEYIKKQIEELKSYVSKMKKELSEKKGNLKSCEDVKIEYTKNEDGKILDDKQSKKLMLQSEIKYIEDNIKYRRNIVSNCYKYLIDSNSVDKIEDAICSLRTIYNEFKEDKHGNISMLAALVYYKMLDKSKFISFVDWIKRNGINKVTTIDDLPVYGSDALIDMFEEIYTAKRNEIFISMQFGDDQSEMIYEKVIQTIAKFEEYHGYIQINPIRIDRNIAPYAFTISDEIMKAIKNSSLIIADLSSGNNNVYHEIGYAMGIADTERMKPPVILLYKTTTTHMDKDKYNASNFVGFNLRGLSQLRFSNYDELQAGLMERLKKHFEV